VRNVLVDFGFTPKRCSTTRASGIDPAMLDALVLSRSHYDHFGGLVGFLRHSKGALRSKIPFYVGGEECFCARVDAPPLQGISVTRPQGARRRRRRS
jgi:7,8-dihydropterin-6-yl-methyl-4-(beta-D-ribofuranosyl)aminobenzene 5'-phosphate synthase